MPAGPRPARRRGRIAGAILVLLVAVLGALVGYQLSRPARVPAHTFVADVPVGGLDRTQLVAVLAARVRPQVEQPLTVTAGSDRFVLSGRDLGIRFDAVATARAVLAGSSWRDRFPGLGRRSRRDVPARFAMDPAIAETTLDRRLAAVQHGPAEARIDLPSPQALLDAKQNASFAARPVKTLVHPGRTGQIVDMATAAAAIRQAVASGQRAVTLAVTEVQPRLSTTALQQIDQLIGSFTTYHACCEPRVTNIHRIAEIVDGTIVLPGATFSLNQTAGRRTAANGFVAAPAIAEGELVQQLGGGVSQFSTTLFNATWFSGLPTLKHQPHSKYISRYPPGREATLDYDTIDQVFRNTTAVPVVIRTMTTDTSVTVALYGHTGDRRVSSTTGARLPRNGGGFSISVQRRIQQDGRLAGTDTVRWTYTGFD